VLLLSELITRSGVDATLHGDANTRIEHITSDSRAVKPCSLFVAMPGVAADGAKYIPDALRAGASAILMASDARTDVVVTVPMLRAQDMRKAVSQLAAAFYANQPEFCMAITGTDGKTSSADFVRQLAQFSGVDAASIGTLGLRSEHADLNAAFPALNTSP
jgi:UDP-N-acetylmuramoyl-L-alanyl-D-glutamate--2,6-diaminopimelate ligase